MQDLLTTLLSYQIYVSLKNTAWLPKFIDRGLCLVDPEQMQLQRAGFRTPDSCSLVVVGLNSLSMVAVAWSSWFNQRLPRQHFVRMDKNILDMWAFVGSNSLLY